MKKTKLIFEEGKDYRFAKILLRLGLFMLGIMLVIYSFVNVDFDFLKIFGCAFSAMAIFPYKEAVADCSKFID